MQKLKNEKLRIAMMKLKEASIQKVELVFNMQLKAGSLFVVNQGLLNEDHEY